MLVFGIDKQWAADLIEVINKAKYNRGYRYLLTVVDVLSKHAWVQPVKSKTGKAVTVSVPPTDLSILSYRMVPIQTFTTDINPVEFQVDPQEDYVDLSRSYFELELTLKKNDANNVAAADNLFPVNNLAHSLFKQISVRLNGTLISPQMDTYHSKAYPETLLNYDRVDGETALKPQGWYNGIDLPATLMANNVDTAANAGAGHNDFQRLSTNQQANVKLMKEEKANYTEGKTHVLRFRPHIEVFHLNKLLVPSVQIGIQMYLNQPDLFLNGVALHGRLTAADI